MKKINIFLVVFISILSFFTVFSELDKGIVIILKDLSIVLTLTIPYIISKLFKIEIKPSLITLWIIFIFFAHYLGVIESYYNKWEYLDKITHTFSGVITAVIAGMIIEMNHIKSKGFSILFIMSFTVMCAGVWEIFEFTCDIFFGFDAQLVAKTGVTDTMTDIIVATIGGIVYLMYYLATRKNLKTM